jgi:hypothetical protein
MELIHGTHHSRSSRKTVIDCARDEKGNLIAVSRERKRRGSEPHLSQGARGSPIWSGVESDKTNHRKLRYRESGERG